MKYDLTDTTFIMPIRVDTVVRLENLLLCVDHLQERLQTHIVVLEAAPYNNGIIQSLLKDRVTYRFVEDKDPVYHKTKYLNQMAKEVKTDFTGIWDVDVIIEHEQILDALQHLRENRCDIAYPYDGDFLDTSDLLRNHYLIHRDLEFLKANRGKMQLIYHAEGVIGAVGGAILVRTDKYRLSGMDNEAFYGWGLEDGERHYRWLSLDFRIYRSKGCLYHLTHTRDSNWLSPSKSQRRQARHTRDEVVNYTKEELYEQFAYAK
jgi:predicted glycosyltransferase involved in capsule biosynthesis